MPIAPVRVQEVPRDMPWGVEVKEGRYAGMRIGEIWFTVEPLLMKYLATAGKLSVQVHPNDEYAAKHEAARGGRGKTEIWYVISAQPGAKIALGFERPMSREEVRAAALDGTLESHLHWIALKGGETIFVPAGTVHALGAGLEVFEIQQNCDITYRLFDYGRGRELHIEKSLDVIANPLGAAPGAGVVDLPFHGKYFNVAKAVPGMVGPGTLAVIEGEGHLGGEAFSSREVWRMPEPMEFRPAGPTRALWVKV